MILYLLLFVIGLLMLYYGAEWLVKGASGLARSLGWSPLIIGLTVVAFGTSTPELVVSVVSSLKGKSMIAVGNVIGSNICNIALVLGLAAALSPIKGDRSVTQRDIPIMLAVSVYLLLISLDSNISRLEGLTLMSGIVVYTCYNYWLARRQLQREAGGSLIGRLPGGAGNHFGGDRASQGLMVAAGIAGVVAGAEILIDAAVAMMKFIGVSEKFIGLTVVALGTSVPELATSVVAALRKEMDISIGNLVGSNVFNILCVLGAASLVRAIPIPGGFMGSGLLVDYGVMLAVSGLPWLMMRKTGTVGRKGGLALLLSYGAYVAYLIVKSG